MTNKITVDLTDEELKALEYVAINAQEWIQNLVQARAASAMEEIYQVEIARMANDPGITHIPIKKSDVVKNANIKTAKQRHDEFIANMPNMINPV